MNGIIRPLKRDEVLAAIATLDWVTLEDDPLATALGYFRGSHLVGHIQLRRSSKYPPLNEFMRAQRGRTDAVPEVRAVKKDPNADVREVGKALLEAAVSAVNPRLHPSILLEVDAQELGLHDYYRSLGFGYLMREMNGVEVPFELGSVKTSKHVVVMERFVDMSPRFELTAFDFVSPKSAPSLVGAAL